MSNVTVDITFKIEKIYTVCWTHDCIFNVAENRTMCAVCWTSDYY